MLRIAVLIVLSAAALAYSAPDIILPWHPFGTFGFDADPVSGKITAVAPKSAAADAGVRVGDRIDLQATDPALHKYVDIVSPAAAGTRATFAIEGENGERQVTLTARARLRSIADNVTDIFLVLAQTCFVLIAAGLVLVRPSVMTWAFFIYSLSAASHSLVMSESLSGAGLAAYNSWTALDRVFGWIGLVIFALRFPSDRVIGWRRIVEIIVLVIAAVVGVVCLYAILAQFGAVSLDNAGRARLDKMLVDISFVGFVAGIAIFGASYAQATEQERPRVGWVITGFILGYGGSLAFAALELLFHVTPPLWLANVLLSLNLAVPLTVAYAVVRYRVIDVRFFLNRALVYGALTTFALAALTVLHEFISKRLSHLHFSILWELGLALAIGLGIKRMHAWIDGLVDRFVFRSVHDAQEHLISVGASMMQAQSPETIDELLCSQSARALHLSSAAVFHAGEDGRYRSTASKGWPPAGADFGSEEELVLALKAQEREINVGAYLNGRLGMPARDGAPVFAIPFVIRHHVPGFALFGAHDNGAALDPDERRILVTLVERAAIAYDQVGVIERDAQLVRQEHEISQLRSENELLRTIAGAKPRI